MTRYSISIGDFMFSGTQSGGANVVLVLDPSGGAIVYAITPADFPHPYAAAGFDLALQASTPNGVIPPIEQFNLKEFGLAFRSPNDATGFPDDAFGHVTKFPTLDLRNMPEGGTSMTLLSCG